VFSRVENRFFFTRSLAFLTKHTGARFNNPPFECFKKLLNKLSNGKKLARSMRNFVRVTRVTETRENGITARQMYKRLSLVYSRELFGARYGAR